MYPHSLLTWYARPVIRYVKYVCFKNVEFYACHVDVHLTFARSPSVKSYIDGIQGRVSKCLLNSPDGVRSATTYFEFIPEFEGL